MASKPQFNMAKMLFSTLVPPLQRRQSEPATRLRFPSPCEYQGHDACTGVDCDCACHLVKKEDEADAEVFATKSNPEGCMCGNGGGGDCGWCQAKQDWMINDPHWRLEAVQGMREPHETIAQWWDGRLGVKP